MKKPSKSVALRSDDDQYQRFSLSGLLPPGHVLVLNMVLGTLSRLYIVGDLPHMLIEQQFTTTEITCLVPLLGQFPYYCPYENLHASWYHGGTSERQVNRSRQTLIEAEEAGVWDSEMRPIRNVLSRMRLKLREMAIDISSILRTGYLLVSLEQGGGQL